MSTRIREGRKDGHSIHIYHLISYSGVRAGGGKDDGIHRTSYQAAKTEIE